MKTNLQQLNFVKSLSSGLVTSTSKQMECKQALQKIAQEKLHTRKNYESLSLFLDEFKSIKLNIKNYTDGIRSTI